MNSSRHSSISSGEYATFTGQSIIDAYVLSCSTAAILYVSEVIKATFVYFSSLKCDAIFAIVVVFPTPVGPIKNITFGLSPRDIVRGSPSFSIIFWYTADRMLSILDSFLSEASISAIISSAYFESTSLSTNFLYISCKNL